MSHLLMSLIYIRIIAENGGVLKSPIDSKTDIIIAKLWIPLVDLLQSKTAEHVLWY